MKLIFFALLMMMCVSTFAQSSLVLKNCKADLPVDPYSSRTEWTQVTVKHESQDKLKNCPRSMMLDEWFVYNLDSMDLKHCHYRRGSIKVICQF